MKNCKCKYCLMSTPQEFWIVRFKFSSYPVPAFHVFYKRKEAKKYVTETYPNLEEDFQIEKVSIKRVTK